MNTHNSLIYKSIINYVELESPEFAILLKGQWGVGKTTFIEKILAQLNKKYIYISLNGICSVSQLYDLLCESIYLDGLMDKPSQGKVNIRALSKNVCLGIFKYLKIDFDPKKILESFNLTEDKLLVFDDVERSSVPLESIFGFINQFVEHKENHVILIANEEEIINNKNSENNI
uniref:P-loop NTPase fold protein n=1 Tax=Gilliamella sp. Nev6-6 TaxID=3120252 RepID=UPI001C537D32